jgi:hypothetical protein
VPGFLGKAKFLSPAADNADKKVARSQPSILKAESAFSIPSHKTIFLPERPT